MNQLQQLHDTDMTCSAAAEALVFTGQHTGENGYLG